MDWRKQHGNNVGFQALSTVWNHISLVPLELGYRALVLHDHLCEVH
jgi:hypothetical protein